LSIGIQGTGGKSEFHKWSGSTNDVDYESPLMIEDQTNPTILMKEKLPLPENSKLDEFQQE
jgi:hypothetical protein